MTFVEVVLTICLVSDPSVCETHKFRKVGNLTPFQCMHYGQQEIVKYLRNKPGFRVKKWTCGRPTEDI